MIIWNSNPEYRPSEDQEEYQPIVSESESESENDDNRNEAVEDESTAAEIEPVSDSSESVSEISDQESQKSEISKDSSRRSSPLLISEEEKLENLPVRRKNEKVQSPTKTTVAAVVHEKPKGEEISKDENLISLEEVEEEKVPIVPKLNLESDVEVTVFPVSEIYSAMTSGKFEKALNLIFNTQAVGIWNGKWCNFNSHAVGMAITWP